MTIKHQERTCAVDPCEEIAMTGNFFCFEHFNFRKGFLDGKDQTLQKVSETIDKWILKQMPCKDQVFEGWRQFSEADYKELKIELGIDKK